jgi:hypothetical protein
VAVFAGIAQLVEQLICNQQVVGSNPTAGSLDYQALTLILARLRKSVFATGLPLLRRKVRALVPLARAWNGATPALFAVRMRKRLKLRITTKRIEIRIEAQEGRRQNTRQL